MALSTKRRSFTGTGFSCEGENKGNKGPTQKKNRQKEVDTLIKAQHFVMI
jgi:hypothetical protein